jgi:hypothetical protein
MSRIEAVFAKLKTISDWSLEATSAVYLLGARMNTRRTAQEAGLERAKDPAA